MVNKKDIPNWMVYECVHCGAKSTSKPNLNLVCWHETEKKKRYSYPFDAAGFLEHEVPKHLWKIVKSKDYGKILVKELGKRIVNEEENKENIIVMAFGGRLIENSKTESYNILYSDVSGAGKDHFVFNALELLPKHYWSHKTRLSEKALGYWHSSEKEPYFSWNGKILYSEDATDYFLNCDTVKIMMTGGSDITIVDKGETKSIKVNGSPIFLVTSATAEPSRELNRRISSTDLDSSEEQTLKIMEFRSKAAISGMEDYDNNLIESAYLLKRVIVEIPYAQSLIESFPKNVQSRTNFDRLLDLIKANAGLHQHSRLWKSENKILANEEDLETGLRIFKRLYPSRNVSLTHAQQKLVDYLKAIKTEKAAAELFREVGTHHYSQIGKMIQGLRSLSSKGFVEIGEGERNGKKCDVYSFIPELNTSDIKVSKESKVSKVNKVTRVTKLPINELTKLTPLTQETPLTDISKKPKIEIIKIDGKEFVKAK